MNNSAKKEWLVRTRSKEILGPFSQTELVEQLRKGNFNTQDEICNSLGTWLSANLISHLDPEEVTRTSSRMGTQSIEFTKSDLTPTPSTTEKLFPTNEKQNPSEPPLQKNVFSKARNAEPKFEAFSTPPPTQSVKPKTIVSSAKYPLATAVILSVLTVFLLNRPTKTQRETSEINPSQFKTKEEPLVIRKAKELINVGKSKQALKMLTNYHEAHSKSELSHLSLYAALLITEGESVLRAKRLLEQLLQSSTDSLTKSEAHLWLGYLLLSEDEGDLGESHFLEALQLNPKDVQARFNLGRTYLKQEKYQQALDYLQLAELALPSSWLVQIWKGWAKHSLGLNEEARKAFHDALNNSKDRWVIYIYQSIFYLKTKDIEAARETLLKMLGRDPDYERFNPLPIGFYQNRSHYEEYLVAFNQVMEKANEEEKLMGKLYLNYLANPLSRTEDWKKMDALANHSHNILPRILSLKMMLPHAVDSAYLKSSLSKLPPNLDYFGPYAYVLRGLAREKLNQLPEAQLDYKRALALDSNCASAMWYQYDLFRKAHRAQEAKEVLKNILLAHPNYIPALEQYSNIE